MKTLAQIAAASETYKQLNPDYKPKLGISKPAKQEKIMKAQTMPKELTPCVEFMFNGREIVVKYLCLPNKKDDGLTYIVGYRWQYFKGAFSKRKENFAVPHGELNYIQWTG